MSRILIVEDDETLRGELSYFLIGNGYEVSVITDFKDTLDEMLKTDTELILLDLNLPGIDGQTLLRMYRKEKNTPVIIVTSKDTEMDELICMTYGADDFVSKPYNPALLLLHIEAVLRRNGGDENVIRYRYLPDDICVLEVKEAAERFHSRYKAVGKTYCYTCYTGPLKPVFDRKYVYYIEETPDIGKMEEAAKLLIGIHDYASFCSNPKMKKINRKRS